MNQELATYSLANVGIDEDNDLTWVGVFPDGPIISLNPTAMAVLGIIDASDHAVNIRQIMDEIRAELGDVPEEAEQQVVDLLHHLVEVGVLNETLQSNSKENE